MFLGAVVRLRWNQYGQSIFNGKIRIFLFIKVVVRTIKNSKNRLKGAKEIKPANTVNKEMYRKMLIKQLRPAIL